MTLGDKPRIKLCVSGAAETGHCGDDALNMAKEVGKEIVKMFEQMRLVPTLFFVDPWGYKGLSLSLINSVLKNWGCDCIIFFNYNRINMGLHNEAVEEHMNAPVWKRTRG